MEGLKLDIDPVAINKYIAEKVMESAIGAELNRAIGEAVKAMGQSYNNPFKNVVDVEIHKVLRQIIETEYSERIKEFVRAQMTDEFLSKMLDSLWETWRSKMAKY